MRHLLTLLLATLCAASGYAQTIKALGYNTTNGAVVYTGTNAPAFTNGMLIVGEADSERVEITPYGIASPSFGGAINFEEGFFQEDGALDIKVPELRVEASVEFIGTNASANAAATRTNLGLGATWLTNGNVTNFRTAIGLGTTNTVTFSNVVILGNVSTTNVISTATNFNVGGTLNVTNKAETRTNLGLGLPALTNDSNVTAMRALSGSTNTNHPFSGSISVTGTNNTNTLVFSNGILQSVQ
jgi:hypothetical protein